MTDLLIYWCSWLSRDWIFNHNRFAHISFYLFSFFGGVCLGHDYQDINGFETTGELLEVLWNVDWKAVAHLPEPLLADIIIEWLDNHISRVNPMQQNVLAEASRLRAHILRSVMSEIYFEPTSVRQLEAIRRGLACTTFFGCAPEGFYSRALAWTKNA
ncbi:hypothetical protein GALMADRAFT_1066262 [Galerina marginata CBS 339.88]|uniref:Uncharacterized protein n=1 Tax=Galerina marginata (strain CBS 339.88) TaxID=685588 RepID=A0A067SM55_GALM3|nr:hypothetical protein GALMADRAFT_1066262 [Galerina marginata CBS 339.88]